MPERVDHSYFHGLTLRLALPVLLGSAILILYYWQLLTLTTDQLKKTFYFAAIAIPLSTLWAIPWNRRLILPVIRYLKGTGSAREAERAAALFSVRSAMLSLGSWFLAGFAVVYYSIRVLHIPESYRLYLFLGTLSAGLTASFVHFHMLRGAMISIRTRIAEDLGEENFTFRYTILMKLLLSFTMLIALALTFFALMGHAHTEEALRTGVIHASTWWETISLIFVIVAIGALVAFIAAADISRHLKQIREVTARIMAGEFTHRLHIVSDDEVEMLAESINKMAQELEHKIEQLQKTRDDAQEKKILLEQANRELMQLDELKSNFLANISHELKAPLVSTKGYVEFILGGRLGPINERQEKGLNVSRDNLNHLARLISSLLDFSRVSTGMIKLRMEACSLNQLIESCVESIKIEIRRKEKEIQISTNIPSCPPIYCDPDRIREVLMNLLMNAEKFTASPGEIRIDLETPGTEDAVVKVSVADTGIGIPKEHLTKIFQRFYQVDGSSTRKYGGTGLGLAIVKEIIEGHGCKIQVESKEGAGSKFTFTLPVHRHSQETRPAKVLGARAHHPAKLVEIIEDDPDVSAMIKMLLEDEGFAVIPAKSGKDALTIAREHKPDLITLDIYLPDMNGFHLLERLRTDPLTSNIPVIVLSVLVDKEKGDSFGVFDYLEKPIDVEKLHQILGKASDLIDSREAPLKIMIVDDDTSTLEFFDECLSREGYEVSTVLGGKEALDRAKDVNPSLILLELLMDDHGGLDVLRELKSEPQTRDIPVIILSSLAELEQQNQSLLMGAEAVIAKPLELRGVVDQVKKYFGEAL
ncbi:response regulator [bacterium]|nr:response regulator [bacterium]